MRRDYFTLQLRNADSEVEEQPMVRVDFQGPSDVLDERLTPDMEDVDIAFRYQTPVDDTDANGVFSVTDRMTGDFVLEVNTDATIIKQLIDAASEYSQSDSEGSFSIRLDQDGNRLFTTETQTLLVYDQEGSLLRQHSLIPSGVEL